MTYGLASGLGALCIDLPRRTLYRDRAKAVRKKCLQTFRKSTGRGTYEITIKRYARRNVYQIYDLRSTPRIFRKLAFHQSDAEKFECATSVSSFVKIKRKRFYVRGVARKTGRGQ